MADPTSFYTGWLVDPDARPNLLARFLPRYEIVVAHHVTHKFGDHAASPPLATIGDIVGEANDGMGVQALVVAIDGDPARPGGGTYHITWSLAPGREARESNDVIDARSWTPLQEPAHVRLVPKS